MFLMSFAHFFSQNKLFQKFFREQNQSACIYVLDPDQDGRLFGPDLASNCLERLSADGARTFRPLTFRPRTFRPGHFGHKHFGHGKMPKVDVSAITINFRFGMCSCINV